MKKFITTVPFQPENKLKKQVYKAMENEKLQYNKEVSFPLLPLIHGYVTQGEEVEILVIKHEQENTDRNFQVMQEQIAELEKECGCKCKTKVITVPYNDLIDTQLATFGKLIDEIDDEDDLYACMTYGTKPIPLVEMMVLNYAYRAKKDTTIGCITYGQVDFNTGEARIYDMTPLFYMDDIVTKIAEMKVKNPAEVIKKILE